MDEQGMEGGGGDAASSSSSSSPAPKKKSKMRSSIGDAGKSLNERSVQQLDDLARESADRITSMKRGGTMRVSKRNKGMVRLHKAERIMKPMRKKKGRMGGRA